MKKCNAFSPKLIIILLLFLYISKQKKIVANKNSTETNAAQIYEELLNKRTEKLEWNDCYQKKLGMSKYRFLNELEKAVLYIYHLIRI